ncbi:MAG: lysine--tRNA ligase, partial [Chthoniobacterales bacterium]
MDEENDLIALRRQKLETLEAKGVRVFGAAFATSGTIAEVREKFAEGVALRVAGRMAAHRDMGKSH